MAIKKSAAVAKKAKTATMTAVEQAPTEAQEQPRPAEVKLVATFVPEPPKKPEAKHVIEEREAGPQDAKNRIASSRTLLGKPLQSGTRLYEAPDGMILVGEDSQPHMWYREGAGGKGCWILPHRANS